MQGDDLIMKLKEITLQEMFNILIDCIMNDKEKPTFYYEREWEFNQYDYPKIIKMDLLDGGFRTEYGDYIQFWELKKNGVLIKEE